MCGMTNTTGSGEGTMDMTVGRINQLSVQNSQSATISGYPKGVTCSTGYCNCAAKDAALSSALRREEVLREALETMLKSAVPHPVEHPTMTAAWKTARAALSACDEGRK